MPIGSLIVKVGADISGIRRDAKRGAQSLGALEKGSRSLGTALKALAIGAVAHQLKRMVSSAMDAIDASAKLSRQLGGTISGLEGLKLAASEAGLNTGTLQKSLEMFNRRLGESARLGSGPAFEALKKLGLKAEEIAQLDIDERMAVVSDAMRSAGYSTQQMADAMGQFGIRSGEVVRLMLGGGDAIRDATTAIEDMGYAISAVDAAKVEAANDAMGRAKMASEGFARKLAVEISPLLTALSKKYTELVKDSKGFTDSIIDGAQYIGKAIGYVADAFRGIHLILKALNVGSWHFITAFVKAFRFAATTITKFVDKVVTGPINDMIFALNHLPGVEITPVELLQDGSFIKALDSAVDAAEETTKDVAAQLHRLASTKLPSDTIAEFFASVREEAQKTAEATTKSYQAIKDVVAPTGPSEADIKEEEALKAKLERQLQILREYAMTEEELEKHRYEQRMTQLDVLLAAEEIKKEEYRRLAEALDKKHMKNLAAIREKGMEKVKDLSVSSMAGGVNAMLQLAANLASGMDSESRTAFDLQKAAAISSAVISGAQGVAQTYGAFPFPINIPFAAAHAALAAAQVAMIASKQFKGGSSAVAAPPPSVPSGATPQTTGGSGVGGVTGGQGAVVNINAPGEIFSRQTVLGIIDQINDAVGDGARIRVT